MNTGTDILTATHHRTRILADATDRHGAAEPQPNESPWRFLCVLGAFAVKMRHTINREGAKNAKNFAKQNSFQQSKDFRLRSTDFSISEDPRDRCEPVSHCVLPVNQSKLPRHV